MKGVFIFGLRLLLGAALLISGGVKVPHFEAFAAALAGYGLLDPHVIAPLAVILPLLEILLGLYVLLGLFTRVVSCAAAALLAMYAAALTSAILRHIPAVCGCFAPRDRVVADWPFVALDAALMAMAIVIAVNAPGGFALDSRLRRR